MRLQRLFSRRRPDLDDLVARTAAADHLVAARVAVLARASERHLAEPDSADAFAALEAAEELLSLAEYEQREARAALQRARKGRRFERQPGNGSRATGSSP